jgi:anti-sigma regulatory factor (Ser/Thr protein kinase)
VTDTVLSAPHSATLTEPANPRGAQALRRAAAAQLTNWQVGDDIAFRVEQVAAELLANAIQHGDLTRGAELALRLAHRGHTIRIEVDDDSIELPRALAQDARAEHGRGMHLVAMLADDWGTRVTHVKTVHAEFHLT